MENLYTKSDLEKAWKDGNAHTYDSHGGEGVEFTGSETFEDFIVNTKSKDLKELIYSDEFGGLPAIIQVKIEQSAKLLDCFFKSSKQDIYRLTEIIKSV